MLANRLPSGFCKKRLLPRSPLRGSLWWRSTRWGRQRVTRLWSSTGRFPIVGNSETAGCLKTLPMTVNAPWPCDRERPAIVYGCRIVQGLTEFSPKGPPRKAFERLYIRLHPYTSMSLPTA